jgi:hypothetical protein
MNLLHLLCSPCLLLVVAANAHQPTLLDTIIRSSRDTGGVDLHGDQFCVDISSYDVVKWVEEDSEECATPWVKKCDQKSENVCAEVVETKCEVVPYTECTMGVEPVDYTETELIPKEFSAQVCVTKRDTVPHTKMVPECRNVTKQNCVTLWETDDDGKQVWAGNDQCEPVTWQECKLVPKDVQFIIPKVECTPEPPIWYHVPEAVAKTKETNTMTCVVKSTTNCKVVPRNDCKSVYYQECKEIPTPGCTPTKVHKPTQELIHRKKCLLPDSPSAAPAYGAPPPAAAPQTSLPSYKGDARKGRRFQ